MKPPAIKREFVFVAEPLVMPVDPTIVARADMVPGRWYIAKDAEEPVSVEAGEWIDGHRLGRALGMKVWGAMDEYLSWRECK